MIGPPRAIRLRSPLVAVLLLLAASAVFARLPIPDPPTRRVNDYAGALTPADRDRLEQKLAARERISSNQVVVAIFPSLAGENLEDYSIRLAQSWRIGQKALDNGVIFLVFLQDRKMRIEVGYGLEATLTDAIAGSIIRDTVAPRFREGKLADGIGAGLDAIDRAIAGTYTVPGPRAPRCDTLARYLSDPGRCVRENSMPLVLVGVVVVCVVLVTAQALRADRRRGRRRGLTGGRDGWTVADRGSGSSWGGSSSSGGWGSSSSDSFGGGGGGFGGGGASGSW